MADAIISRRGGADTSDANAVASDILSPKTAYVNDNKITGSIPSKTAQTYTPTTTDQIITPGQYLSGTQIIKGDANLIPSKIPSDLTLFGVTGTRSLGINGVSGTTPVTSARNFYREGAGLVYSTYIEVTGLSIIPKIILVLVEGWGGNTTVGVWQRYDANTVGSYLTSQGVYRVTDTAANANEYAQVYNDSFLLPVEYGTGRTVTWRVFTY